MAGTLKKGAASAPNTRTVWSFVRPAGQKITFRTAKEPTKGSEVAQTSMHGEGSTGPYAIATGHGEINWKTSVAKHEFHAIVAKAKLGNIPLQGKNGLLFDQVSTTTVDGIPKMTVELVGCSIGKFEDKTSPDGDMVDIEGKAVGGKIDGVDIFDAA